MTGLDARLEVELQKAIRHFWAVRLKQLDQQGSKTGTKDAGNRAAVTGGKHGDGFIALLAEIVREAGIQDAEIHIKQKTLPSYFRPTKDWDLIVKSGDDLIAVIEVKAHVGSFGNNFNNRVEEAIGSATDFWSAYREATFKPSARPWLGYLMMLEEAPGSIRPGKFRGLPHYPVRDEFRGVSYAERYQIFCERLVRERLYDATCFLMSSSIDGINGNYIEPSPELGFRNFTASLSARALAFSKVKRGR
jgi:restriction endonuclease XhoI-like protein